MKEKIVGQSSYEILTEDNVIAYVYDFPKEAEEKLFKTLKDRNPDKSDEELKKFAEQITIDIRDTIGIRFNLKELVKLLSEGE